VGRGQARFAGTSTTLLLAVLAAVMLSGCGSFSGMLKSDDTMTVLRRAALATEPIAAPAPSVTVASDTVTPASESVTPAAEPETAEAVTTEQPAEMVAEVDETPVLLGAGDDGDATLVAQPVDLFGGYALAQRAQDPTDAVDEEYDPWESFNEKMFAFNRGLDRWVLKPVARGYMFIMPEPWQVLIGNGFDNINFVPRLVNSLLQAKWSGAGRELARFLINSTAGIGGLFDPAKDFWGIHKSREDFGQTLGVWGSGPGPYLVLPFMEPLTVRDGIGKFVDGFMDPLSYFLPFFFDRLGMKLGDIVNERALNYDLFQGFEESVIDMYSAVRHGYLQRRQQLIRE
jgi:phospholipid-binding lipoprotein MlaA